CERGGPTREERLHAAAPPHQRVPDRLVRGTMCLERREPERQAQHHHDEQRRGEEDPGGEATPPRRRANTARVRHPSGRSPRSTACSAFPVASPAVQLSAVLPKPPGA